MNKHQPMKAKKVEVLYHKDKPYVLEVKHRDDKIVMGNLFEVSKDETTGERREQLTHKLWSVSPEYIAQHYSAA